MSQSSTSTRPMTVPAGYKWEVKAAEKAGNDAKYIRVGGDKAGTRRLSGAERTWKKPDQKEANAIFITEFRITGTPEDITQALRLAGYTDDDIRKAINSAITRDNYDSSKKGEYDEELALIKSVNVVKAPTTSRFPRDSIVKFGKRIKDKDFEVKKGTGEKKTASSPKRPRAVKVTVKTQVDKVIAAKKNQVVDVSNMDSQTGVGGKIKAKTGKLADRGIYGIDAFPIVSNDLNKYFKAIEMTYGKDHLNQAQVNAMNSFFNKGSMAGRVSTSPKFLSKPGGGVPSLSSPRTSPRTSPSKGPLIRTSPPKTMVARFPGKM